MSDESTIYGVVLFHTNSSALRAEKILLKSGLTVKLVPTPRELSSDCGVALRFNWNDDPAVRARLIASNVEISSIHEMR
jgi:hypothetical protein